MGNARIYAEREFEVLRKVDLDSDNRPLIEEFKDEIIALVDKFGMSGQSGGSAPYTAAAIADAVKKLCLHMPISPITGDESEWEEDTIFGDSSIHQNKRCTAVFGGGAKEPSYLDAIVWRTGNGSCYGGSAYLKDGTKLKSCLGIKQFPLTLKTFYIDVIDVEVSPDNFVFVVKNEADLDPVWEIYVNE